MSTTESPSSLTGAAQEIPSAWDDTNDNTDTNPCEPRESRDEETVSESSPGHGEVKIWQWVQQPDDEETHSDHGFGSGSEADSGAGAGVWRRVDPGDGFAVELGVFEDPDHCSDADESSCGNESDLDRQSNISEQHFRYHEDEGLWLLRSDPEASFSVVDALLKAGQPKLERAYSDALIKLAGGGASLEEVLGDLAIGTIQPGEASRVDREDMRRRAQSGGGSTELSLGAKAVALCAVTFLASSAKSGYNPLFSSASGARPADLSSVSTREKP